MMLRRMGLIGVPSSAGAHWPGQEKAPGVLRGAGHADEEGELAKLFVREVADALTGKAQ